MKERILDGCYYPECNEPHDPGKKFCDLPHDKASLAARNGNPTARIDRTMEPQPAHPFPKNREATFPDHPITPKDDAVFTHIPGSEDMDWDDEPEDDDDWMDDPQEQESWIAQRLKEIK